MKISLMITILVLLIALSEAKKKGKKKHKKTKTTTTEEPDSNDGVPSGLADDPPAITAPKTLKVRDREFTTTVSTNTITAKTTVPSTVETTKIVSSTISSTSTTVGNITITSTSASTITGNSVNVTLGTIVKNLMLDTIDRNSDNTTLGNATQNSTPFSLLNMLNMDRAATNNTERATTTTTTRKVDTTTTRIAGATQKDSRRKKNNNVIINNNMICINKTVNPGEGTVIFDITEEDEIESPEAKEYAEASFIREFKVPLLNYNEGKVYYRRKRGVDRGGYLREKRANNIIEEENLTAAIPKSKFTPHELQSNDSLAFNNINL